MNIVIDMQGAQSASRVRGIGRYSLALSEALVRNPGGHQFWLVFNGALPEVGTLQQHFAAWVPRQRMRVFDPPLPVAAMAPANAARAGRAELLREYFIAQPDPAAAPDIVLLTSLFEGFVDDAVTSVARFTPGHRTAVVLYDLIPYLNPASYLVSPAQQDYYEGKIASLRAAGFLLAISEHSRREAIDALGLPAATVHTISTAVDARFCPGAPASAAATTALGIVRPFVLLAPGGSDPRKNLPRAIAAFGQLPAALRQEYQLVIASGMDEHTEAELRRSAVEAGLARNALVLTGYVDDTLLIGLYRACTLFVFPSLHEGFGLPALEAMACGAAVIGADNSSIPEVIGLDQALFDGADPAAMAAAIARALTTPQHLQTLRTHGLAQARRFSWERTAARCLRALEQHAQRPPPAGPRAPSRPRLAFVSPLPPERSGIADYAAQLLPALLPYFDIELVLQQTSVALPEHLARLPRHSSDWFLRNGASFDQVLYQFGNSPFHGHMFSLLEAHPGVVVLHDFYLSRVLAYEQMTGRMPGAWIDALYHSHGYPGMLAAEPRFDRDVAHETYPCNLAVLQRAEAVIVHSQHSKSLATHWYGPAAAGNWHVVPLPRMAPDATGPTRAQARAALGIDDDVYLVCSFGFIAPTKLSDRLIDAWQTSALSRNRRCMLVLVGDNHGGAYGEQIVRQIDRSLAGKITIAGWTDDAGYHRYLRAADAAVQLRRASRGETSAAVLDCLNYGLPTIVNANGSMAELPADVVCMIDEEAGVATLSGALERMHADPAWRHELGQRAAALIDARHRPEHSAAAYAVVLGDAWRAAPTSLDGLTAALRSTLLASEGATVIDRQQTAVALAQMPDALQPRQLLVDVTNIAMHDLHTGIERVVRAQVLALLRQQGPGSLRIEPVHLTVDHGQWHYRYAHGWTQSLLSIGADGAPDHVVDIQPGDIFFGADYAPAHVCAAAAQGLYERWRARGVAVQFQVFDLLPVLQPQFFPPGADLGHQAWLAAVSANADRLVCISDAVAQEMATWCAQHRPAGALVPAPAPVTSSLHLGADLDGDTLPRAAPAPRRSAGVATFLMVGTIEPRKGHLEALAAFELLWKAGVEVALTIVGGEGWKPLPAAERRTIPRTVKEIGRLQTAYPARLQWLRTADDAALTRLYKDSDCLLVASEGEGFGLPLIEAARHGLPLLVRDLPVFREVAGTHASYYSGDAGALADAVRVWLAQHASGTAVPSAALPWLTWNAHAQRLVALLDAPL